MRKITAVFILLVLSIPARADYTQLAKLTASDAAAGDDFGVSVAVSGSNAIVGAPFDDDADPSSGSAYLYDFTDPCSITEIKLTASDAAGLDRFGWSVAISGATAIVGTPYDVPGGSAYLFDVTTGSQIAKLTASDAAAADNFGYSVAVSGTTAIMGAWFDDDAGNSSGSAYLYDFSDPCSIIETKLTASDADAGDTFGISVAISGATALVGAHGNDDAGSDSGSAYLYDFTDPCSIIETKLTASDAAANDVFGWSVAISGSTAIVGAYANGIWAGSAYLFDVATGTQIAKLTASDATVMDWFGYSVAINGTTAIVGAYQDDDACPGDMGCDSGSAYLYDFTDPCSIIETKLTASDDAADDNFGVSVAFSSAIALVGADGNDDAGNNSGSAYLFKPCSETDGDGDGVGDDCDNCPATYNPIQTDTDGDGDGNACDDDDDNDGVPDGSDTDSLDPYVCSDADSDTCDDCTSGTYNPANDGTDTDADGICDAGDNCPTDPNKTEPGICGCGVADTDTDTDGVPDCVDNCPVTYNPGQEDDDSDGLGNVCDNCPVIIVAPGNTILVDADATGANDGSSWADAYNYLQDALAVAQDGNDIWVAAGIYKPDENTANPGGTGSRTAAFQLINGVALYGGFAGCETSLDERDWTSNVTSLSGDINTPGDNSDNSYHVVTGSGTNNTAVLDGFTITAGNASDSWPSTTALGGGMYNSSGSPTITNCMFIANSAESGGGMWNWSTSSPTVTNCTFSRNSASANGGGMFNYFGGSNPTVTNCMFIANSAMYGGGMFNNNNSPTLTNCTFSRNLASANGGGMHNNSSSPTVTNCILWSNSASTGSEISNAGSTPIVTYSDVAGDYAGTGNIDADPLFIDPNGTDGQIGTEDDNLRLQPGSPCIDAANSNSVPDEVTTDLDGRPRFIDDPFTMDTGSGTVPIVDMGAYEFSCGGDFDGDGQVDGEDFVTLFSWWMETGCGPENDWCDWSDSNKDGQVNMADLLDIIINWLAGTGP